MNTYAISTLVTVALILSPAARADVGEALPAEQPVVETPAPSPAPQEGVASTIEAPTPPASTPEEAALVSAEDSRAQRQAKRERRVHIFLAVAAVAVAVIAMILVAKNNGHS
jgi:hypothetical protein